MAGVTDCSIEAMNDRNLNFTFSLSTLPDDAVMEVSLPDHVLRLTVGQLLDTAFPEDETDASEIEESFDVAENPDLPEIYEEFLRVTEQFRQGLCRLHIADQLGHAVDFQSPVSSLTPSSESANRAANLPLQLSLTPEYDALSYAREHGYTAGEPDLIQWLQICLAIYYVDKHEAVLPAPDSLAADNPLKPVVEEITRKGLVTYEQEAEQPEITPDGRRFIGSLLSETEGYIDRYDMLQDVVWDEDGETALFGTGHGADLRVEAFIYEGLDPVRAVFLLRLYDGTMDEFAENWTELIGDEEFLNSVLEPVVNRDLTPAELLEEILEQSMALLEADAESAREDSFRDQIARRVTS